MQQNLGPHMRAEVGGLGAFGGEGLVVVLLGGFGVEAEVELVAPAELEPGAAERVVVEPGGGVALGEVGGVGGELVGDDPDLDVVAVGQAEMLLGRDVAKHRGAEPADHRRADAAGDMVVAGRDVGDERAQGVEGRLAADFRAACPYSP